MGVRQGRRRRNFHPRVRRLDPIRGRFHLVAQYRVASCRLFVRSESVAAPSLRDRQPDSDDQRAIVDRPFRSLEQRRYRHVPPLAGPVRRRPAERRPMRLDRPSGAHRLREPLPGLSIRALGRKDRPRGARHRNVRDARARVSVASSAAVWPKSLALVGAGKMGGAMLRGWLAGGLAPGVVAILDPAPAPDIVALAAARGLALTPPSGMKPEVLILAVKPQMLDTAATAIAALAHEDALVISIIAGKTIANLKARAPKARAFVRAMPNTPAAIGRGVTGAAANDAVTALSGSGPAYVFALVEAMAAAGEALGLPSDLAMRFARGTVEGAGELLAREPETPAAQLRQNVTSPAGTTAAALKVLQSPDGLDRLVREAIAAAHKRAGELAG